MLKSNGYRLALLEISCERTGKRISKTKHVDATSRLLVNVVICLYFRNFTGKIGYTRTCNHSTRPDPYPWNQPVLDTRVRVGYGRMSSPVCWRLRSPWLTQNDRTLTDTVSYVLFAAIAQQIHICCFTPVTCNGFNT